MEQERRTDDPRIDGSPSPPGGARGHAIGFDLASAVLLMATGTYEKIRDQMRTRPDLLAEVKQWGAVMLKRGVTPDMEMVKKLRRIILQAQKNEKERQEASEQKNH